MTTEIATARPPVHQAKTGMALRRRLRRADASWCKMQAITPAIAIRAEQAHCTCFRLAVVTEMVVAEDGSFTPAGVHP